MDRILMEREPTEANKPDKKTAVSRVNTEEHVTSVVPVFD